MCAQWGHSEEVPISKSGRESLVSSVSQFSQSVQLLSRVRLFVTPWTVAHQASPSITNPQSLLKLMFIESLMPSNHLTLHRPLLLLPSIFPSIRVFSKQSALHIRWPKYWSFSFSISPSNEYSGLISFRMDWLDLLEVQGTLRVFCNTTVQKYQLHGVPILLYGPTVTSIHDHWKNHNYMDLWPYMTIWIFVSKVMPLLFNMLSRFVIDFLPRSK